MITNERQHRITKSKVQRFRASFLELLKNIDPSDVLQVAQRNALQSQLDELESEIADYEALRSGEKRVVEIDSLDQLPSVLVQARTAAGLSQRELAERLGLKEQQIQRYESTSYSALSLDRLLRLIRTLGIEIPNNVILNADQESVDTALVQAEKAGVSREFVLRRLLPQAVASRILASEYYPGLLGSLVRRLEKIYGWSAEALLTAKDLRLPRTAFSGLAYKAPKNASEKKLAAYTVYAHYLALAVLDTVDTRINEMPTTPAEFRRRVETDHGEVSLSATLQFAWNHGVAVLPLKDTGAFHGACWRVGGRSVIVLKQNVQSRARWLFDLIHELRHTQQCMADEVHSVIESAEANISEEEKDANRFAGNVVLSGRAEELTAACVEEASGNIRFLKRAATRVANNEGVDVAQLANYLAFRLALQGENWWGAAANLQPKDENPWEVARDIFLKNIDISRMGSFDRELLARALEF